MQNIILSVRIKEQCKLHGITVKALLEFCEMNRNTIYDLEKKSSFPSADKMKRIADYLNTSVDYLLGRTDDPTFVPKVASNIRTLPKSGGTVAAMDGIYVPPRDALSPEARDVLDKAARLEREKQNEIE